MSHALDETYRSDELDPLFDGFEVPDLDAIDDLPDPPSEVEDLSDVLRKLLLWLIEGNRDHHTYGRSVSNRG